MGLRHDSEVYVLIDMAVAKDVVFYLSQVGAILTQGNISPVHIICIFQWDTRTDEVTYWYHREVRRFGRPPMAMEHKSEAIAMQWLQANQDNLPMNTPAKYWKSEAMREGHFDCMTCLFTLVPGLMRCPICFGVFTWNQLVVSAVAAVADAGEDVSAVPAVADSSGAAGAHLAVGPGAPIRFVDVARVSLARMFAEEHPEAPAEAHLRSSVTGAWSGALRVRKFRRLSHT